MPLAAIFVAFLLLNTPLDSQLVPGAVFAGPLRATQDSSQTDPDKPEQGKKNEPTATPEQTAPRQSTPPSTTSPETTPPTQLEISPVPPPAQTKPPRTVKKSATNPTSSKSRNRKPAKKQKKAAAPPPTDGPPKVVVRNGSTSDPKVQIAPKVTDEQAAHDRQNTTQLLAVTEANLSKLSGKQLDSNQQDTVRQIRQYVDQSKVANKTGDLQRAQNLASKARMLSDELLKH